MDLKSSGSKLNAICILNYLHHKNAGLLIGQELNGRDAGELMQSRVLALWGALFTLHIVPTPRGRMEMDKTC